MSYTFKLFDVTLDDLTNDEVTDKENDEVTDKENIEDSGNESEKEKNGVFGGETG